MITRAQAWAWYFDRNSNVAAAWGHQNGRWPMHLAYVPEEDLGPRESIRCNGQDCWCHIGLVHTSQCETYLDDRGVHDDLDPQHCKCWCHSDALGGGDEDAREGDADRHGDRDSR